MNAPPKAGTFRDTQLSARADGQRDIPYREAGARDCMWPAWSEDEQEPDRKVCGLPVDPSAADRGYCYCPAHIRVAYPAGAPERQVRRRSR